MSNVMSPRSWHQIAVNMYVNDRLSMRQIAIQLQALGFEVKSSMLRNHLDWLGIQRRKRCAWNADCAIKFDCAHCKQQYTYKS